MVKQEAEIYDFMGVLSTPPAMFNYEMNILVVEDVLTTRLFIKKILKKLGFNNIFLLEDGDIALEEIKRQKFDLIISDWHMPNLDGIQLFKALKKDRRWENIPFLLLTAEKEKDKVIEAIRAGIAHYMVKPVQAEALEFKIKEACGIQ
ncbi:MAG: response regulator [Nitrospinae bacterium CG11_big_fil_rev_8_21_14_0_20_56_8]|nr:MAG: response regulator [Nitrospinae bacterium CG11_big_fil_rev_8_21_14_0_20_56_8]